MASIVVKVKEDKKSLMIIVNLIVSKFPHSIVKLYPHLVKYSLAFCLHS
jgi:hypothetical protein